MKALLAFVFAILPSSTPLMAQIAGVPPGMLILDQTNAIVGNLNGGAGSTGNPIVRVPQGTGNWVSLGPGAISKQGFLTNDNGTVPNGAVNGLFIIQRQTVLELSI